MFGLATLAVGCVIIGLAGVQFSDKLGTIAVKAGYNINFVVLVGYTPPHLSQKGVLGCPLLRRGPVRPNTLPEKKKSVQVRAWHGLRASWQRVRIEFRPSGASASAFRGRFLPLPPNGPKTRGYTLL